MRGSYNVPLSNKAFVLCFIRDGAQTAIYSHGTEGDQAHGFTKVWVTGWILYLLEETKCRIRIKRSTLYCSCTLQ